MFKSGHLEAAQSKLAAILKKKQEEEEKKNRSSKICGQQASTERPVPLKLLRKDFFVRFLRQVTDMIFKPNSLYP